MNEEIVNARDWRKIKTFEFLTFVWDKKNENENNAKI